MIKNYKFKIIGHVQGVYYRKNVYENSIKENFNGYVKNLADGSVEACVSCKEHELDIFIEILKKGSTKSVVEKIEHYTSNESFSSGFEITY